MKNTQPLLITITALLVLFSFTQCKNAKDKVVTKILEIQAEAINKNCPQIINSMLRLDSCQVLPEKTLKSYYTITSDPDIFTAGDNGKADITYTLQTNEDLKQAREHEVTFIYAYYSEGNLIKEITITAEDYNKPIEGPTILSDDTSSDAIDLMLQNEAKLIKEKLPTTISPGIIMVECEIIDKTLAYTYQSSHLDINDLDSTATKSTYTEEITQNLKRAPQAVKALERGYNYKYIYNNSNGEYKFSINISSNDL